jgi:hypothetical protein
VEHLGLAISNAEFIQRFVSTATEYGIRTGAHESGERMIDDAAADDLARIILRTAANPSLGGRNTTPFPGILDLPGG